MRPIVLKIGTSSLTQPDSGRLALSTIATLVEVICDLRDRGYPVVLVSSGAVGVGCARLGLTERPKAIAQKQAVAAVGQGRLMRVYDDLFSQFDQPIAQVLLTRGDLAQRSRYINAYSTFQELLRMGAIPIVNENDTVAVDELKFGDNDTLSALVASLVEAEWLFLLTDVDRLYSADPRQNPNAEPIRLVEQMSDLEALELDIGGRGSQWGTGGMATKITAAQIGTSAGVRVVITDGSQPRNLLKILEGADIGTQFAPQPQATSARKRWIAHGLIPAGKLYLDSGAVRAICTGGGSLLAAGIRDLEGEFQPQDAVQLCDLEGREVARGLVNFSHEALEKICGKRSDEIAAILGHDAPETVVHRDNLVLAS
ncbi:MAG: glutamate 5-kinase [Limnothrix sp.]|uniref:glutamate 5-kinase n=1 Tax=Limnothrix sp. PR1529 TaxID=1704291 RepID=UPI00081D876A|nr:glutamate 5-kinase [Limnothrix sp. PR1529]MEB3117015.1 glutamate 5-kinase [Limnothrix sp.]OCQ97566.1 glutamate 5-kinase [Limnothrix sp. P13C2]PIB14320.1 glutamate 5-kinase [Limnothrix sp. PR1529]